MLIQMEKKVKHMFGKNVKLKISLVMILKFTASTMMLLTVETLKEIQFWLITLTYLLLHSSLTNLKMK